MCNGTILIVDDDHAVRHSLSLLLREEGLDVETYVSGPECLENCVFRDVICAIVDYHMPSMSGQSARAIYKQLLDFKSGARVNTTMCPVVAELTPRQMAIAAVATQGDAARALPACQSCHAARAGGPFETPMLMGQYPDYFTAQLRTYADGSRHNDLYGRMRAIAAKLTDKEIDGLAVYYNAPP